MKKTVFLAFLVVGTLLSSGVKADINCAGGKSFNATVNEKELEFCVSNITLNWWSAMAWCKAHGLELVEVSVFGKYNCNINSDRCLATEITDSFTAAGFITEDAFFTKTVRTSDTVYRYRLTAVGWSHYLYKTANAHAVCMAPSS